MTPRRVAIVGLGLIGASLGGALRRRGDLVCGLDADTAAERAALDRGLIDEAAPNLAAVTRGAALVILAVPVLSIIDLLPQIDAAAPPEAVIMDVGSVKEPIVAVMERLPGAARTIGGHPIAGKELAGPAAADISLFVERAFVLVPHAATSPDTLLVAEELVRELGALPTVLGAGEHDRTIARTSHLPQLLSLALALSLQPHDEALAGTGLRDMTRLAASGSSMWNDILLANAANIRAALDPCLDHLNELVRMAAEGDSGALERLMSRANGRSAQIAGAVRA